MPAQLPTRSVLKNIIRTAASKNQIPNAVAKTQTTTLAKATAAVAKYGLTAKK
jgi:hypothetical protein